MEFIIIGLFIIFFSYILLYSLYVRFFKSSDNLVEGMSANEKGTSGLNQSDSANSKLKVQREAHPNVTFKAAVASAKKPL
jgi:uncharacterized membrane protein